MDNQQDLWQEYVGAVATPLVGRNKEVKRIYKAIESGRSNILFILGRGGIGKTFLTREILNNYSPGGKRYKSDVLIASDLVDFYNTDNHALEGLTSSISKSLSSGVEGFESFNSKLKKFITQKYDLQGQGKAVEDSRKALLEQFLVDFRELTGKVRHIVLVFDTIERLFSASSLFKEALHQIEARRWLRETFLPEIIELNNVTVLLAGRPEAENFVNEISNAIGKHNVQLITLGALDFAATKDYFAAVSKQMKSLSGKEKAYSHDPYAPSDPSSQSRLDGLTDSQIGALQQYTEGRPILLALAVDYLLNSSALHPLLFETEVDNLKATREAIIEDILKFWQTRIRNLDSVIELLAWAQKGVNKDLLVEVLGVSDHEATIMLENLKKLAFIKTRPADERCFLHDEMLLFVRQYILPSGTFTEAIYNKIIHYYDRYIRDIRATISRIAVDSVKQLDNHRNRNMGTETLNPTRVMKSQELADNLIMLKRSISENGFYRLMREPESGSEYIWIGAQEALSSDAELITLLQSVVMEYRSFLDSVSKHPVAEIIVLAGFLEILEGTILGYGNVLRSIKNAIDDYNQALRDSGEIWHAEFELLKLTARIYLSETVDEELKKLVDEVQQFTSNQSAKKLFQAKMYNLMGYTLRVEGDYHSAIDWYEKSRNLWRDLDYSEEDSSFVGHLKAQYANTLNNLSWAYAEVGKLGRAVRVGADALELRLALGPLAPVAFSQNTLGLISIRNGKPVQGQTLCQQALNIFEDLELLRGVGMAKTALAEALRRSADLDYLYPSERKYDIFSESAAHIEEAIEIFSKKIPEPARLVEAYIEAGCVYRDWAWLDRRLECDINVHFKKGKLYLAQAIEEAKKLGLLHKEMDSQVNLAWLYFYVGKSDNAVKECYLVIGKLPENCHLLQTKEGVIGDCTIWSQVLGKTYLLLGEIARERSEAEYLEGQGLTENCKQHLRDAGKNYALSLAYDQMYAADFRDFRRAKDLIYDRIKVFGRERMYALWEGVLAAEEEYQLDPNSDKMRDLITEYFGMMD